MRRSLATALLATVLLPLLFVAAPASEAQPASDPLPRDVTWWDGREWTVSGRAERCTVAHAPNGRNVIAYHLHGFSGTIRGFDPATGGAKGVTSRYDLVLAHIPWSGSCRDGDVSLTRPVNEGVDSFVVALNFTTPPQAGPTDIVYLGPGTVLEAFGRADRCEARGAETLALGTFEGELQGRRNIPGGGLERPVDDASKHAGPFALVLMRDVPPSACASGPLRHGGSSGSYGHAVAFTTLAPSAPPPSSTPPGGASGPGLRDVAPMPRGLARASAVAADGQVYVFGGETATGPTDEILRYDPAADRWHVQRARLPSPVAGTSAVFDGSLAYVFGLADGIVAYDPATDTATLLDAKLPSARSRSAAAFDGRHAWILGGLATDARGVAARTDEIVRFTPATGEVRVVDAKLRWPVSENAAVWTGQRVVSLGGEPVYSDPTICRGTAYDPFTGAVSAACGIPPYSGQSAIDDGNATTVFGGTAGNGFVYANHVGRFRWDLGGRSIDTVSLGAQRAHTAAALAGGVAYVIGGFDGTRYITHVVAAEIAKLPGHVEASPHPGGAPPREGPGAGPPGSGAPPSGRAPCYDLLSCPIGDTTPLRDAIRSLAGRVEGASGQALRDAPVLVFREEDGLLKPAWSTTTDAEGRFMLPDLEGGTPRYVAALLAGHLVARDLAPEAAAALAAGGALAGLALPAPPDVADKAGLLAMTPAEAAQLRGAIQDAKPYTLGTVPASQQAGFPTGGYAGIDTIDLVTTETREDVRVIVVRMTSKGSDRIPDPPSGTPRTWFAAQVVDGQGREVPLDYIRFFLDLPADADPERLVVHHFRLADGQWETLQLQKDAQTGRHFVVTRSLSLFALAENDPSTFALVVKDVAGSPYTLMALGAAALVGGGAYVVSSLRKRAPRAPTAAAAEAPRIVPVIPPGGAAQGVVQLPGDEFTVSGLTVDADGTRILTDVSFGFPRGQVLALLGPSGSGKSTTLRCILGETPHQGEIDIFGLDPGRDKATVKRAVGYVAQETQLYPDMTVQENVEYFGRQYGLSKKQLRDLVPGLLAAMGLDDRADTAVRVLSGGQQRRASIAATLVHGPAILILDEPTSGLDPITRRNLWKFVKQANRELGVSAIVTTHFLDEADLADRVVILHRGKVVAAGAPAELVQTLPGGGKVVAIELASASPALETKVREAIARLAAEGLVKKSEVSGYDVRLFVADAQQASRRALDAFDAAGVPVKRFTTVDAGMDDVFAHFAGEAWQERDAA